MSDGHAGIVRSGRAMKAGLVVLSLALGALLSIWGASNQRFWDDEANTAIFARNLLKTGRLSAWDGVNVMGYRLGVELNEHLENTYMPPLQYYVAAAGQRLFGNSTTAGRILFIFAGLCAMLLTAVFARQYLGRTFPWWLPAMILALSPAYLMYIRQCRYYPLGVLFCMMLLVVWVWRPMGRGAAAAAHGTAFCCVALLFSTSYLNAAAVLAILPLFWLHRAYRTQHAFLLAATLFAGVCISGAYVYLWKNPFEAGVVPKDPLPALERFATLLWWHLKGMASFEFFPVGLLPLLLIPWISNRWEPLRRTAARGWLLVAAMAGFILVTALFSPQPVTLTDIADMRYVVPLIAVGSVVTAIAFCVSWRVSKVLGLGVAALTILTNGAYLGGVESRNFRSTLRWYIYENLNDYRTGTEALVEYLADLPRGTQVEILPGYMAYSPMYYQPGIHYCCQLSTSKKIDKALQARLPGYIFTETARPEILIAPRGNPMLAASYLDRRFGPGGYTVEALLPVHWVDGSRPEIPWHFFVPPPGQATGKDGFVVIRSTRFHPE